MSHLIEYSAKPIIGSISLRRAPDRLTLTIHPTFRRIATLVAPGFLALLLVPYLFLGTASLVWGAPQFFAGAFVLPVVLVLAALYLLLKRLPVLSPLLIEVTPAALSCHWRTLASAKSLTFPREDILAIRTALPRFPGLTRRHHGLIIVHRVIGDVRILRAGRQELLFLANILRENLGMVEKPG